MSLTTNAILAQDLLPTTRQDYNPIEAPSVDFSGHVIHIQILSYGYSLNIGCQSFAFEDLDKMMNNLKAYLKEPNKVGNEWMKNKNLPVT